ncbi:glycogen synthase [Catonella massiliensis]|nr:glycogen/starch synthase [Catonella massiliensis]
MAGKKLKNKEADKKAAEAAVKEAVKEKSEVMVLPEKKAELKVVETKAPVKDAKPVAEVNASDVKESKALEDVKPVKRGRKKAEETDKPVRRGRNKAEETAKPAKRGRKKAEDKETEEPKKADKKTAKKEAKDTEVKAEKKTRKTAKTASKTEVKEPAKRGRKKAEAKEPAKRGRKKAEVKETKDNVEQVAAMINKEITKEVKKSKKAAPEKKKILFVGSEVLPFAATGGLGEVLGSLPKALAARGDYDVRVMMPYYSDIGEQYRNSAKYLCNYNVGLSWRNLYCGLFELKQDNVTYYFIDNEYYFHRDGLYGFYDDGERYAFFCKAVMDSFYFIDFMPDIIHANDWQTALIPIYNNSKYHYDIKLIFTIHNIEYQGQYDLKILPTVFDLPPEAGAYVEYEGCINLVKGAIETSDCVTTVSESYAKELEDPAFAHGLQDMIKKNNWKTRGILNGIDAEGYDPATDTAIAHNFTSTDFSGKVQDKLELQRLAGLREDAGVPVIAIISRLVAHKGLDLITKAMENIVRNCEVQLVVLGKGDRKYEDYFIWLQNQYNGKVSAMITYNKDLSRKVYAGADMFLMPSKAEPCGLSQMIACRYGTVPIVRETGGLRDSIVDCSYGEGNGFTFADYNPDDMANAIYRAIDLYYNNPEGWDKLRKYISTIDFSWAKSADKYDEMYSWLLGR